MSEHTWRLDLSGKESPEYQITNGEEAFDPNIWGETLRVLNALESALVAVTAEREKMASTALRALSRIEFMVWAPKRIIKRDLREAIKLAKEPFLFSGMMPAYETSLTAERALADRLAEALDNFDVHMQVSSTYMAFQDLHRHQCRKRLSRGEKLWDVEFRDCGWFACKMAREEVDYLAKLHIRAKATLAEWRASRTGEPTREEKQP